MLQHRYVSYLSALTRSCRNSVTFITIDALARGMVAMSKDGLEIILRWHRASIRCQFVADAARCDLCLWGVAGITIVMCRYPDRYGLTSPCRLMTGGASLRRPALAAVVGCVVKLHIEPFFELRRKLIHRGLLRLKRSVTDRAHGPVLGCYRILYELAEVTSDTRFVPGIFQLPRLTFALMA